MFQFPRLPPTEVGSRPSPAGFPHSGTPGSKAACASPGNIAACRALRRPPVPRHPPRALRYHALPPQGGARALTSAARSCRCGRRNPTNSSISLSRRYAALKVPGEGPGGRTPSRLFLGRAGAGASVDEMKLVFSLSPLSGLPRKEVIQPHLPVRLPCYDFTPLAPRTFDASAPLGFGRRLRVQTTRVV